MHLVFTSIIFKLEEQSLLNIMPTYCLKQPQFRETTTAIGEQLALFSQDNARVNRCVLALTEFNELGYEFLPYPSYSPNLSSSD